jgi:DNA-binding transcriptional regulator YhcF (GntR family)
MKLDSSFKHSGIYQIKNVVNGKIYIGRKSPAMLEEIKHLHYDMHMSVRQIAEKFQIGHNTVRRALGTLKDAKCAYLKGE